jgi:hypothetical protein
MENKFGRAYTNLNWEKRGPASRFMKDFEGHKRDFGKSTGATDYYEMSLVMDAPDSDHYDRDDALVKLYEFVNLSRPGLYLLTLRRSDLKALFDPVITRILSLIESQMLAERKEMGTNTIKVCLVKPVLDRR